ncbi:MAG: alcohol dehydrogenase catalytic domain-containing protein, partial [Kangiellaceae bacterium]|nr:alcohol dehydrogenase catalytic domain-containing protein [Kangiellaceae bacterium]
MKAAVYYGAEDIRSTEVDEPSIKNAHEALVEVSATSICGSDLHLYRGAMDPIMDKGRSQTGHELVGVIKDVGKSVSKFKKGDRISMGYSCSGGECYMCEVGEKAHCETTQKA